MALSRDSRATAYFLDYFIQSNGSALGRSSFLPSFTDGLVDSEIVEIFPNKATYGAVYNTPAGRALEMIHFTRDKGGAWKINDF